MIRSDAVFDVATLKQWATRLGYEVAPVRGTTVRIVPRGADTADVPPFYAQCTANWLVLSILPILPPGAIVPHRWLLERCRAMRVAKFAIGEDGAVALSAELPTESLDFEEFEDAALRMVEYALRYRRELGVT